MCPEILSLDTMEQAWIRAPPPLPPEELRSFVSTTSSRLSVNLRRGDHVSNDQRSDPRDAHCARINLHHIVEVIVDNVSSPPTPRSQGVLVDLPLFSLRSYTFTTPSLSRGQDLTIVAVHWRRYPNSTSTSNQ